MSLQTESDGPNSSGYGGEPQDDPQDMGDETAIVKDERPPLNRSTMLIFLVLVLGAGSLYYMYRRTGPATAGAAVNKEAVEANKAITTFLDGGDSSVKSMRQLIQSTEKRVQEFQAYPSTKQVPLEELPINPFRQFAPEPKSADDNSAIAEAAERQRRDQQRQAVLKAVQSLQLQSIMFSDTRSICMINNNLFREGQTVENFYIEKISPASVVVKNGAYRFELKMQR